MVGLLVAAVRAARFLAAATIAVTVAPAAAEELGGRPFSNPDFVVPMPKEWVERSVEAKTPQPVDLALSIDQQLYPAILPLVQRFARENNIVIAMQEGTCGLALGAAADKSADIAGYCCPPGDLDRLPGLRYHTLGIGAVALITHPSNPLSRITLAEARAAFAGEVSNWSELPVSGISTGKGTVRAVGRLHCKARPTEWQLILANENMFGFDLIPVPAIGDMIGVVANTPGALGYETLWHIAQYPSHKVKVLALDGVDPHDSAALAAGRYPLFRVFSISSWADAPAHKPLADRLVRYLIANAANIDPVFGFVPVQTLREGGWKFKGDELVGKPDAGS